MNLHTYINTTYIHILLGISDNNQCVMRPHLSGSQDGLTSYSYLILFDKQ